MNYESRISLTICDQNIFILHVQPTEAHSVKPLKSEKYYSRCWQWTTVKEMSNSFGQKLVCCSLPTLYIILNIT